VYPSVLTHNRRHSSLLFALRRPSDGFAHGHNPTRMDHIVFRLFEPQLAPSPSPAASKRTASPRVFFKFLAPHKSLSDIPVPPRVFCHACLGLENRLTSPLRAHQKKCSHSSPQLRRTRFDFQCAEQRDYESDLPCSI
jgi:hypothetical protein